VHLKAHRKLPTQQVIKDVQKSLGSIPGIRATVSPYDLVTQLLTGGATNMEIDVFGQDNKSVAAQAKKVMDALKGVPGLEALDLGVQDATPELQWKIDRDKASALGVSFADIANTINSSTGGAQAGYFLEKGYQYPIYVILPEKDRKSVESLANLAISPKSGGKPLLLNQVATPFETVGPNEITRLDRQRYIAVNGRLADRSQGDVEADVRRVLEKMEFAPGTYWDFGQNQKRRGTEFAGLGVAVVLAVALIYMLLASQFESFVYPLIVLTSVPLCAVGVVLALFLTGRAFGITAFIGLLMLVGIVVKNGILLVDYTNQLRERGTPRDEAILTASPTRLRPILMTTSAAVLGMFPLALALGQGSETQAPLATAVIGGLITSTVLTLFVVPCVYTLFDDLGQRLRRR
jgi:HAE1 family hydrophobic/amphiphilic exporter-1